MKTILRTAGAIVLGYIVVVLVTEFGFRLFPGGRAPKHGGAALMALATLIAILAGFSGGFLAGALGRARGRYAAGIVALPLVAESIWLLTTRTPPDEFWGDLVGAVTLIASVIAGGISSELRRRRLTSA
jgi:hypothetical protein